MIEIIQPNSTARNKLSTTTRGVTPRSRGVDSAAVAPAASGEVFDAAFAPFEMSVDGLDSGEEGVCMVR